MRLVAIDPPRAIRLRTDCVSCHTSIDSEHLPVYHDEQGPRGADYYCATCAARINMPQAVGTCRMTPWAFYRAVKEE